MYKFAYITLHPIINAVSTGTVSQDVIFIEIMWEKKEV